MSNINRAMVLARRFHDMGYVPADKVSAAAHHIRHAMNAECRELQDKALEQTALPNFSLEELLAYLRKTAILMASHEQRVTELLAANNALLERARKAEAELEDAKQQAAM